MTRSRGKRLTSRITKTKPSSSALVPAGARSSASTTSRSSAYVSLPAVTSALDAFESALGGRSLLIESLATSPDLTPELRLVLALLADPRDRGQTTPPSLGKICAQAGITPGELFAVYKHATVAKAALLAIHEASAKIVEMTQDAISHCVEQVSTCSACDGMGMVTPEPTKKKPNPNPEKCFTCAGSGKIKVPSSLEHQKFVFDLLGLVKKSGLSINQQVLVPQVGGGGSGSGGFGGGSLEQLQQAVGDLLYGRSAAAVPSRPSPAPIDAETIPPTEASEDSSP